MSGEKRKDHPLRHGLEYFLVLALYGLCRFLPESWVPAAGSFLGGMAYALIPSRRRITLDNLDHAFKGTGTDIRKIARESYRSLGKSIFELLRAAGQDRSAILRAVRVEGRQHVEEAVRQNRGVIYLGAHYGNWELMNLVHSAIGYPSCVVARAMDNPWLNRWINRRRERFGATVVNSKDPSSLRTILSTLHRRGAVAFLIDQNVVGDRGVYVDFFGRLAYTHKVVALVALKTGAPVVPMFIRRDADGSHCLSYGKALPLIKTGDREKDVSAGTQMMTRFIEEEIRRRPDLWLWMHDRWKKQPRSTMGAVFLDRDGTISKEVGYIHEMDRLELLPNSARAIRRLNDHGIQVIVVTNQSGVARGFYPEEHVRRVNERLTDLLRRDGAAVDAVYYCPHHPTEGTGAYTKRCDCRKPEPGLLLRAASERDIDLRNSFVVGDKLIDIEMAHRVGAQGILVLTGYGEEAIAQKGENGPRPDCIAPDLDKAVEWIVERVKRAGPRA